MIVNDSCTDDYMKYKTDACKDQNSSSRIYCPPKRDVEDSSEKKKINSKFVSNASKKSTKIKSPH